MELTVGEVWLIPGGTLPSWKEDILFALASDGIHWSACQNKATYITGKRWSAATLLNINEKHPNSIWEEVRLYAIQHLVPPQLVLKFYRFKNLDLE